MFQKVPFDVYVNANEELDLERLGQDLNTNKKLQDQVFLLEEKELNFLFKALAEDEQAQTIGKLLTLSPDPLGVFDPALVFKFLKQKGVWPQLDSQTRKDLLNQISDQQALVLVNIKSELPQALQKKIEKATLKQKEKIEKHKKDLLTQIDFLKKEKLFDKALELEQKLHLQFPSDTPQKSTSFELTQNSQYEKQINFSNVIQRNLSFDRRKYKRDQTPPSLEKQEDLKLAQDLAPLWLKVLQSQGLSLFLTQLEFLDFSDSHFYEALLKSHPAALWEKIDLFFKANNLLEGLAFLDTNKDQILDSAPENVYSFYYTKALFLLKLGMRPEAEKLLTQLIEQDENFRDAKTLINS